MSDTIASLLISGNVEDPKKKEKESPDRLLALILAHKALAIASSDNPDFDNIMPDLDG